MPIEFDYKLERDEGNEVVIFHPDGMKSPLPDLARIIGPNSSGKSTVLNILALGLYGERQVTNEKLREQIAYLRDSKHQKLSFSFTLNCEGIEISASKEKGDKKDIVVSEKVNGKTRLLDDESFLEKYELIYDIPDNPIRRLSELGNGVKRIQQQCMDRISDMALYVGTLLQGITNAEHVRMDKERLEKDISTKEKESLEVENDLKANSLILKPFRVFAYTKLYIKSIDELDACKRYLKAIRQEIKNTKRERGEQSPPDKGRLVAFQNARDLRQAYQEMYDWLIQIFPKEKKHLEVKRKSYDGNFAVEELQKIYEHDIAKGGDIDRYGDLLKAEEEALNRDSRIDVYNFYSQLVNWIRANAKEDFVLPGIGTTLSTLLSSLDHEIKKGKELIQEHTSIHNSLEKMADVRRLGYDLSRDMINMRLSERENSGKRDGVSENDDMAQLEIQKTQLEEKEQKLNRQIDTYLKKCAKLDISEGEIFGNFMAAQQTLDHKYDDIVSSQLEAKVGELESEHATLTARQKLIASQIDANKLALSTVKSQESPPFSENYKQLVGIRDTLTGLQFKFRKYSQFIEIMLRASGRHAGKDSGTPSESNDELSQYSLAVSSYLAHTLGRVRHINKTYELSSVDLLNQKIVTREGKEIRLAEMGTGQSQAAFLVSLLSRPTNRKLIVLFDEVSMLDDSSRNLVFSKIESLYKERKLLAAIIVEPGKELKVLPIQGGGS